ncbi:MAG: HAD family hydrolase, partial [Proteobacteria bacterium]|nr:HAD family hydrolase [Pseudomonadota bacterium]
MSKIKLVIFDLDGVLVDSRELHFHSLNKALSKIDNKYVIGLDEHLAIYDGLPTSKKLQLLTEKKLLPANLHTTVWELKQQYTSELINDSTEDCYIKNILKQLKQSGKKICCCTNSIRDTAKLQLIRKGFFEFIDHLFTNEDVKRGKPSAEMYLKAMITCEVDPDETVIIEDSHIGRKAATRSGAYVLGVKNSKDLNYNIIEQFMNEKEKCAIQPKWQGANDLKVLIPMAGAGSRFEKMGYTFPKPLIDVRGKPMIQRVIENINVDAEHIFIVQKSHYE